MRCLVLLILALSSCTCGFVRAGQLYRGKWKLVFADEFDGPSLNLSNWDIELNCWGGGNNEKQCYTGRPQNIFIESGILNIRAIRENFSGRTQGCTIDVGQDACTRTQPVTSARIRTLNAKHGSFLYGRFESRAKMPTGDFTWPAIWMLPTDRVYGDWAASGEIDMMEYRGQDRSKMLHTLHFGGGWPNNRYWGTTRDFPGVDFTRDFHTFVLEWEPSVMRFYVDEQLSHTQSLDVSFGGLYGKNRAPFDQKFHMILNLAIGGNFFGSNYGPQDLPRVAPGWTQPFQIDFVRIYRDASNDLLSPPSPPVSPPTPCPAPSAAPQDPFIVGPFDPVHVPVDADTFVWGGVFGNSSFAASSLLALKSSLDPSESREVLLRFNLTLPAAPVESAALSLFGQAEGSSDSVRVDLFSAASEWSASSLTWESRPMVSSTEIVSDSLVSGVPQYYQWNVTNIVETTRPLGAVTFLLRSHDPVSPLVWFVSSKLASFSPVLRVEFRSPAKGAGWKSDRGEMY